MQGSLHLIQILVHILAINMDILTFSFMFLLGLVIGSFLNVVIYRFNSGKTIGGRSICLACSKTLNWYELIPVLSFLFQKGRCRGCASKISHQYPLVELVTGFVFALIASHFLPILSVYSSYLFLLLYFSFVFSLLIVIAVYDIRHKIIPDSLVYFFVVVSFCSLWFHYTGSELVFVNPSLLSIFAGPILALPFALIWLFSQGKLMGLGDAKLIIGIGFLLGFSQGIAAIIIAFWIGAVASLIILLFGRFKITMKTELPFAPFLILGTFLSFIYSIDVFSLSAFFRL